jgi:hypothetical protein
MTCGLIVFFASEGHAIAASVAYRVTVAWTTNRVMGARRRSCLAALADEPHRTGTVRSRIEIADGDGRSLARARACVVEEQQDPVITPALLSCAIRRGEERVDLRLVQVAQAGPVIAFERHGANLTAPGNQLRAPLADERRDGMDRG